MDSNVLCLIVVGPRTSNSSCKWTEIGVRYEYAYNIIRTTRHGLLILYYNSGVDSGNVLWKRNSVVLFFFFFFIIFWINKNKIIITINHIEKKKENIFFSLDKHVKFGTI